MPEGKPQEWLVLGPPADPYITQATAFSAMSFLPLCGEATLHADWTNPFKASALALVFWDSLLTLDDEVIYIWSRPGRMYVKFMYLFARWFGLLDSIGIKAGTSFFALRGPVSVSTCEAYLIVEAATFLLIQLCLDVILLLRISAVYQRRRQRYIIIASMLVLVEIIAMIMGQVLIIPKSVVDGQCMILETPTAALFLWSALIVGQSVLFYLTFRGRSLLQPAAKRSKIVTVVVRDGMLVFGVGVGVMLVCMFYILFRGVVLNIFLPWIPPIPSILVPRMILNMQKAVGVTEHPVELTTEFDITSAVTQAEPENSTMYDLDGTTFYDESRGSASPLNT